MSTTNRDGAPKEPPRACLTDEALARSFQLCPQCGTEGVAHRAKLVCPRCRIPIMTCCD